VLLEECGGTLLPGGRKLCECLDEALGVRDECLGRASCLVPERSLPDLVSLIETDGVLLL